MERRVLFANDDKVMLKFAKLFYEVSKYEVIIAENGLIALEKYLEEKKCGRNIDLIITDIQMPRMSGTQFIVELRNNQRYVGPIGIVSGTDVSEYFIKDNDIFYVGFNIEDCIRAYEKM